MSKTNPAPTPANQSAPAPNALSASAARPKPSFAAAARSGAPRPVSGLQNQSSAAPTPPPPSFASAVGSIPPPSTAGPAPPSNPPAPLKPAAIDAAPRPINGSAVATNPPPTTARTPAGLPDSRRTSVAAVKAHNVKPSASSHIAFGSLADLPAKADAATAILSSSPANPPTLTKRDGPPVFGSVAPDPSKKPDKPPPAAAPVPATLPPTQTTAASAVQPQQPPKTEKERRKFNFHDSFMAPGETPAPPPASSGSSPSPSMSFRQDPTQNRRPNTFDGSNQPHHGHPASPRSAHLGPPNGAGPNSFQSPLSGASRAFTPGQAQPPLPHLQPQGPPHHYGQHQPHWQGPGGQQGSNPPHFVPGGPSNHNMSYPHPNGAGSNSQNQFLQKPPGPGGHRNGPGPGVFQPNTSSFPPNNGRSHMHHPRGNTSGGPGPSSPRLPSSAAGAPGNGPPTNAPYPSGPPAVPYWPGPYPPSNGGAPGSYPYNYNASVMPTYPPHPQAFVPPQPQPLPSHPSPQMAHQPGPLPLRSTPLPPSPAPPVFSPGAGSNSGAGQHTRGPSLSYNAPSFSPSVVSPEMKPRGSGIPNAAAPPFQPRKRAPVLIKTPDVTPVSATNKGSSEPVVEEVKKEVKKDADAEAAKKKVQEEEEAARIKAEKEELEKKEAEKKRVADELAAAEKKRVEEEKEKERLAKVAADEAEAKRKSEEAERLEREAKEKAEKEKAEKEQAEKEKAEKEKAEKEAKEKAEALEKEKEKAAKIEAEEKAAQKLKSESVATRVVEEPSILPSKPVNGSASISNNKVRPTPIDVNAIPTSKSTMSPALPSALSSARKIEDLGQVSYPDNIQSPRPDLNVEAAPGKFRYDRAFLLQFMEVCKGKPAQLPDLDSIGLDAQSGGSMSRTQSGGGQRRNTGGLPSSGGRGPLTPSGSISGFGNGGGMAGRAGSGGMPMFAGSRTSEERFSQSNRAMVGAMPIGSGLMLPGRPTGQMSRTPSTNALPGIMSNGARDTSRRSGRGSRRDGGPSQSNVGSVSGMNRGGMQQQPMYSLTTGEIVQPLQASANSWATARSNTLEEDSPEMVNRKVRALLNKLTLDKFESISDQVIVWANKSEKESDGRILRQVIALIFEKATDEAHWSEMYAKLCRKLMEKLSAEVKDEGVLDNAGNKVHGGQLFRKYLLNRCQEDYERGWTKRDELAAAAAGKAADDAVKQAANEKSRADAEAEGKADAPKEAEILSDEYYAAQKAKRQGLGLVRFIGELFKLNMLTERIMHECIKKLLSNIEDPEEEDIESLCRLMMTVGKMLDHEKANSHMNVYFSRMATLSSSNKMSSRAKFMILDVIDTRKNHWVGRNVAAGPKLTSQIREEAAAQAAEQSRQASAKANMPKSNNDLSRGGSRGGRNRGGDQYGNNSGIGPDGWSVPVPAPLPRSTKAGDLTGFGTVRHTSSSSGRATFGPSMAFANKGKKDAKGNGDLGGAAVVTSNSFAALNADVGDSSGGPTLTKKPSISDIGGAAAGGDVRRKLNLAPRTLPLPGGSTEKEPEVPEVKPVAEEKDVDDATAERLVKNRLDEFLNVKSIEEAVASFEDLPTPRHFMLIQRLLEKAMEFKASNLPLMTGLFEKLKESSVVSKAVFKKAFEPVIECLDDTSVDAPSAYNFCGKLLVSAGFELEEVKVMSTKIEPAELTKEEAEKKLIDAFSAAALDGGKK